MLLYIQYNNRQLLKPRISNVIYHSWKLKKLSFSNSVSLKTVPYTLHRPLTVIEILNHLNPSGNSIYHRVLNIRHFHVLPTQFIYVFCTDLRTNSNYFPN
jgi:hypothetical protein